MSVSPSLTPVAARLRTADCDLDEFVPIVAQRTDARRLSRWPPTSSTTCWSTTPPRFVDEVTAPDGDEAVAAELVRALTDGPGRRGDPGRLPGRRRRRPGDRGLRGDHRRGAAPLAGPSATTSPRPVPTTGSGTPWRSWPCATRRRSSTTTPTTSLALVSRAWLGPGYQVTSQVNVVRPGGQAQDPHRDYHLGFLDERRRRALPGPRAPAVARADPAGRGRPLRHARRERADDVPAVLPPVRPRLSRLAAARVPRVLRAALRPAAAGQGRRGLLQPGPVPRRRHQRLGRHPAHGQPAPGLLGVRPGDGDGGPGPRDPRGLPGAAGPQGRRCRPSVPRTTRSRPPPRATRSRPTSTSTSPSAVSPPGRRPRSSPRRSRPVRARGAGSAAGRLRHSSYDVAQHG